MNVAIIGATGKPDRYAHKAQRTLAEHGHSVIPISPSGNDILGAKGYTSILEIPEDDRPVHTVTLYVNPSRLAPIIADIKAIQPTRIIFNPGTESDEAAQIFRGAGIHVVEACTLVLLATGQFESA